MKPGKASIAFERAVQLSCAGVLGMILTAGLWPFHAPANQVSWVENEGGLEFRDHGSAVSIAAFPERPAGHACSLELWLTPSGVHGTQTILAYEGSDGKTSPFTIQQAGSALRIRRHNVDKMGTNRIAMFDVDGAFQDQVPLFATVVLDVDSTSVYLNGVLAKTEPIGGESSRNFTGRLVLANAPFANDSWSGRILGLASYEGYLTASQILHHYRSWTQMQRPAIAAEESPSALYLFNERAGATVHNQVDHSTDLTIPADYFVLHPPLLTPPWREYKSSWSYWQDFSVNIAGFIPLGLVFFVWFSAVRSARWTAARVIALGFAISLMIEALQSFLPTRNSDGTDLVTNTLGAAIGIVLCRTRFAQYLLSKAKRAAQRTERRTGGDRRLRIIRSDSAVVVETELR